MKNLLSAFLVFFIVCSCSEDEKPIQLTEEIQKVEKTANKEEPKIEIISDFKKIAELKKQIIKEQELARRAHLDSISLAMRLVEYDSLAYDSINILLRSGNTDEIKEFLAQFIQNKPLKYQLKDESIKTNLLGLVNYPELEKQILVIAGNLGLDYESTFVSRFNNGSEELKPKYFYWIGRKGKNMEVLQNISDQIKNKKINKEIQKEIIVGLRQFSNSRNKDIKEKAISSAMLAYDNKWITTQDISTLKDKKNRSEIANVFLKMILDNGGLKAKSIHNVCLNQGVLVHKVFRNLVQTKDNKTKSTLVKQLENRKMFLKTISSVPLVYKMEKDSTIPIITLKMLEKHKAMSPEVGEKINYIFSKMNSRKILLEANKYIKDEKLIKQLQKLANRPKPAPRTYEEIVLNLFDLKITDSLSHKTLDQIKTNEIYQGKNGLVKNILHYNKQLVSLDKWSAYSPIKYDFLLNGIRHQLGGEFGRLIFKSEFKNNAYSILIIGDSKAVYVHPENKEDEIDALLLVKAVNEVLVGDKLLILNDDSDFINLFFGSQSDLDIIKSLMQTDEDDLPI